MYTCNCEKAGELQDEEKSYYKARGLTGASSLQDQLQQIILTDQSLLHIIVCHDNYHHRVGDL